jgi:hypothetical protein
MFSMQDFWNATVLNFYDYFSTAGSLHYSGTVQYSTF